MNKVTLQISLAPSDFRHSQYLLEHQYHTFASQVDEILLTYDTHKSKGRFAINWEENNTKMWSFLVNFTEKHPKTRLVKIDYSKEKNREIAKKYFQRGSIPAKDWRGGPFYTYFFGLNEAKNDLVFHIDSDMFFGGQSQTWISEALELFKSDNQILFINPLPGPPREDITLIGQNYTLYKPKIRNKSDFYFQFLGVSTRLFLVNKKELEIKTINIPVFTFRIKELIRAILKRNPPFRLPEEILSEYLIKNKKIRVDFLGESSGLWSLHPPYRTEKFYQDLPQIIKKVETGDIPKEQKGFYDIVDELADWTLARMKLR